LDTVTYSTYLPNAGRGDWNGDKRRLLHVRGCVALGGTVEKLYVCCVFGVSWYDYGFIHDSNSNNNDNNRNMIISLSPLQYAGSLYAYRTYYYYGTAIINRDGAYAPLRTPYCMD
jgi:hypothetical protein